MVAIADQIKETYIKEKCPEAVRVNLSENKLTVDVLYCPAVKHLKSTDRNVSPWYRYTTEVVMEVLAQEGGFTFCMDTYDPETGAAKYRFDK